MQHGFKERFCLRYHFYIRDAQKGIIIRHGIGFVFVARGSIVEAGTVVSMILKMSQNTNAVSSVKNVYGEYL